MDYPEESRYAAIVGSRMCFIEASSRFASCRRAFTLIELLVVIAIIAILAAILLPVLHQAQLRGETAACIDHQKQLAEAWVMYAQDNNDGCAGNNWSGAAGGEEGWQAYRGKFSMAGTITTGPTNWVSGWLDPTGANPGNDGESDNTNADLLIDPSYASLGDYIKNAQLFICPSCEVKVAGWTGGPRIFNQVRSYSMNCWVGYIANQNGQKGFKQFTRTTTISGGIDPSDLFVFMEERGESIDDGSFLTDEPNINGNTKGSANTIANFPTDYHNNAATVGFADGHVDVHRWVGEPMAQLGWSCTAPQNPTPTSKWNFGTVSGAKYLSDVIWLQTHATCENP
ncbi:MAG: prepilin-type N-terminal cleavage/methylation domain-containing protein [Limisphaerales bacterium]